ncbi:arginyltransferase [Parasulfuritortus cantonensis]|uniref:Aspartate/glutamate leucyltransferase n=1 Tax=Parasulfuritortus cantonensis TaxID=2528202 RepID=A0A4R1BGT7_9PROT|nr:arginyltransferase [Parasulfuritortus cantonensis]TCJ16298.1 arginyltransferase [Parasulfuritortus cantonensis]
MALLTELPIQRLQFYLTAPYPCSYLPDRQARSQVATPAALIDTPVFSELAHLGFRRSGHYVYRPRCDNCAACHPVRLAIDGFVPRRSQRRCRKHNADLKCVLRPLEFDERHYQLYRRYQAARHKGGGMDMDDREQYRAFLLTSGVDSGLAEFSLAGEVVMVSLFDRLLDGLSAVYAFYDPDLAARSLGVYNVLTLVDLARGMGLPYVYLGYWIKESAKMAYKSDYRPLEIFRYGIWKPFIDTEPA